MKSIKKISLKIIVIFVVFSLGCATTGKIQRGSVLNKNLQDGVYTASSNKGPVKVEVEVVIDQSRIETVRILKHRTLKGKDAESIIPDRITRFQSTEVDGVSGATMSSIAIMNAVQLAIDKAGSTQ